jgi:AcrR family transcriptional regulator
MPVENARAESSAQTRDRLLLAAAELLESANGEDVSTRAICERAGVRSPTLYHHFGSKERLLDAVVSHGFRAFLASSPPAEDDDPIERIRTGWDLHVRFGLENPSFYALVYGRARPGQPCAVVADLQGMILETLQPAAANGRLRVAPDHAAEQIVAASSGVALSLIAQPEQDRDFALSDRVRDAILDSITTPAGGRRTAPKPSQASAAVTLAATLDSTPADFSETEAALLREWLQRLAG